MPARTRIVKLAGTLALARAVENDSAISMDMTEGAGSSAKGTPTSFVGTTTAQGFEGFRRIEGLLK